MNVRDAPPSATAGQPAPCPTRDRRGQDPLAQGGTEGALPRMSVVICTDGRADALAQALDCCGRLDGPPFELCVVQGPTPDGTDGVLDGYAGRIKRARTPHRNLSLSRNVGIALAANEVVAFLDDDGLPEPEWLVQLAAAFQDPRVGGAGGMVLDPTGTAPQYPYPTADRLGNSGGIGVPTGDALCFPLSFSFPFVQGVNSAFRRDALVGIGGFDEEYEYFLDETDVCCRLVDAGWLIRQLPDAFVHHKHLPNAVRTAGGAARTWLPMMKNKLYFSLVNNRGHHGMDRVAADMARFVAVQEDGVRGGVAAGRLPGPALPQFQAEAALAWQGGLARGLAGRARLLGPAARMAPPALEFTRAAPDGGREVLVFVSHDYPPSGTGGVSRYIHQLAHAAAALGHQVHVLTLGAGPDQVDFEDGVWVHRLRPLPGLERDGAAWTDVWAGTALHALRGVARRRAVTAAYAPIWMCGGSAVLRDGGLPLVLGLQTPLRFWLDSNAHLAEAAFPGGSAARMVALEAEMLRDAHGVHAISGAIARDIAAAYGVPLPPPRTAVVPLALDDWAAQDLTPPDTVPDLGPDGAVRLLFVGRLEARKGIGILLDVLPRLLRRFPHLHADLVGNDAIPGPDGPTPRAACERALPPDLRARLSFHGEVSDSRLRGFYRACDLVVVPSRYESFGLMLLEAMIYGKPVAACRVGGMVEVAEEGRTALFCAPDDPADLEACLARLVADPDLRRRLGAAGRRRYEDQFTPARMARGVVDLMRAARDRWAMQAGAVQAGGDLG